MLTDLTQCGIVPVGSSLNYFKFHIAHNFHLPIIVAQEEEGYSVMEDGLYLVFYSKSVGGFVISGHTVSK